MKPLSLPLGILAGSALWFGALNLPAQDWPQWRGPNRDGKASQFNVPDKWPAALTQKWKTTVGTGDATPALVGDKLYVFARQGAEEINLALNAADGKVIWQEKYEAQTVGGPASSHPGPRSTPAVAEGKVVTLGVGGVLSCLDAASGKLVWRKDEYPKVVPRFFTSMSPIIVDGLAIAQLGGPGNGGILAFDLASGNLKWKWTEEGPAYASPALLTVDGARQIVTLTEKSVVGIAVANGKLCWQIPFAPQGMAYNAATPIVDGQTVIFTGQNRGTKSFKVEKQGDGFAAKELWVSPMGAQFNSPVLNNNFIYGISDKGNFFCLDARTGQTAWTDTVKRGNYGGMVDAGSAILALPNTSELVVLKPSSKQYEELAKIKVAETPTFASPVPSGKRLFIKDKDSVTLWVLE
jgi:outer membrane protein assembly factor BamB